MKNVRYFAIIDYLKNKKYCSVAELMTYFNISSATIHRDIAALADRGIIQKVHGGVTFIEPPVNIAPNTRQSSAFQERIDHHLKAKREIAELAYRQITEGDILFLDSSTTVFCLAEKLLASNFAMLTLITNSVMIIQNFHKFPIHYLLIGLGGSYDPQLNAFLGQAAMRELDRLAISKAFVSAFGVNDEYVTTNHENHCALLGKVIDRAEQKYLLADHSKFNRTGLFRLAHRRCFNREIIV